MVRHRRGLVPGAREEFHLSSGVRFDNHANALDGDDGINASQPSTANPSKPDQFCIHRVDGTTSTLIHYN